LQSWGHCATPLLTELMDIEPHLKNLALITFCAQTIYDESTTS
jgi:hypothetical protein